MKADPHGVLTGTHFIDGDHACCEGALAAGARFAAGYPITPSTEVVERFASRVPTIGGCFIHMEEELADSVPRASASRTSRRSTRASNTASLNWQRRRPVRTWRRCSCRGVEACIYSLAPAADTQ